MILVSVHTYRSFGKYYENGPRVYEDATDGMWCYEARRAASLQSMQSSDWSSEGIETFDTIVTCDQ